MQAAVVSATSDLAGVDDALAILGQHKIEAERQFADERERIERTAAADKLSKRVAAIEAALPGCLEQSRALAEALSEVSYFHFEFGQMAGFVQNTLGQIEIAANFTLAELKAMPDAIRQGRQAIPRELVPAPVAVTEPTPETQTVFMLRSAHDRDHVGRKRFAGRMRPCRWATAQRALDKGIAVAVTDPRFAQLHGARGGDFDPQASDVVGLDTVEESKGVPHMEPDPVLRAAAFSSAVSKSDKCNCRP